MERIFEELSVSQKNEKKIKKRDLNLMIQTKQTNIQIKPFDV